MLVERSEYIRSIGGELHAQADRVRNLIGGRHWASDGYHKEALLRAVLGRHLPAPYLVSRGFTISPDRSELVSNEQDVLIINPMVDPPVLNEGGLVITFPRAVVGAISVKTTPSLKEIRDAVKGLMGLREILAEAGVGSSAWTGVFFFADGSAQKIANWLRDVLAETDGIGPNLVCTYERHCFALEFRNATVTIKGYDATPGAAGIFISHLLAHLAELSMPGTSGWEPFGQNQDVKTLAECSITFER